MIYKPTKVELDRTIQDVAGEVAGKMLRWQYFANQLNSIPDADLTGLGYDSTALAYLRSFQAALLNIERMYSNEAKVGTDDPSYFVSQMTRTLIF